MTTYLTSDIRYLINQESFFGSLTCKINQGQLEKFNNEIYYDLLRLLTLKKHRMSKLPSPENSIEPCWYHSKEESEAAFDQTVKKLEEWHKMMVGRILSLQDKSAELRIRGSVRMTLQISTTKDEISTIIKEGLEQLDSKNKICTPINCICNQLYTNCPYTDFIE